MTSPNIVIVGHVCVDENTTETSAYTGWGSPTLYMAQYLQAHYYVVPLVVSNYGPDLVPYLPVIDMIPNKPNQEKTLLYMNDTRVTPRSRKVFNAHFAEAPALTPAAVAALEQADIIIVATLLPNYPPDYLKAVLAHGKPSCLKVLSAQGYFGHVEADGTVVPRESALAPQLAPLFDLVMYSEEDHPEALAIAKKWAHGAPQTQVVVTQGPNGATIVNTHGAQHIPATPVPAAKIVDSVGCGDVFGAALAYAFYMSKDLPAAVAKAHRAAGKKLLARTRIH